MVFFYPSIFRLGFCSNFFQCFALLSLYSCVSGFDNQGCKRISFNQHTSNSTSSATSVPPLIIRIFIACQFYVGINLVLPWYFSLLQLIKLNQIFKYIFLMFTFQDISHVSISNVFSFFTECLFFSFQEKTKCFIKQEKEYNRSQKQTQRSSQV